MKQYKITKISGKPNSHLPVGTVVTGPSEPPMVGDGFLLTDSVSAGEVIEQRPGAGHTRHDWFSTTMIKSIEHKMGGTYIHTQNSTWKVEKI